MNRTESIIDRFPHFFHANERYSKLYQYVDVFSQLLDGVEDDLRNVRNAHFVNKADNRDSRGFDSIQKGDLDKIFSLYLENLGGTSLLKQTNRPKELEPGFARWLTRQLNRLSREVEDGLAPSQAAVVNHLNDSLTPNDPFEEDVQALISAFTAETSEYIGSITWIEQRLEPDQVYRERIKGLIQVLLRGASTKQGIIDIVAANLGIVGETEAAVAAKSMIEIREFMPKVIGNPQPYVVQPFQTLTLSNPNPVPSSMEVRLSVHEEFRVPVSRFVFRQVMGGQSFGYTGELARRGTSMDVLVILPTGRVLKNGTLLPAAALEGAVAQLPPGESDWMVEVYGLLPPGKFEDETMPEAELTSYFDFCVFDQEPSIDPVESEAGTSLDALIALDVTVNILTNTPASFSVVVPWDIPGYTEKLDTLADQPRFQIPYIVNKVKAAGVYAEVEYVKRLRSEQEMLPTLIAMSINDDGHLLQEGAEGNEGGLTINTTQTPDRIVHELSDNDAIITSALFDYTHFDSDNRFT